jgi:1-deoxy-D-xylulose-5-phosphate reductoisomerase
VYNAANEEAVAGFVADRIGFLGIVDTVAAVLAEADAWSAEPATVEEVLAAERWARARARELMARAPVTSRVGKGSM